jgi:hypothetical protein
MFPPSKQARRWLGKIGVKLCGRSYLKRLRCSSVASGRRVRGLGDAKLEDGAVARRDL